MYREPWHRIVNRLKKEVPYLFDRCQILSVVILKAQLIPLCKDSDEFIDFTVEIGVKKLPLKLI